jgi:hypothetical protein
MISAMTGWHAGYQSSRSLGGAELILRPTKSPPRLREVARSRRYHM